MELCSLVVAVIFWQLRTGFLTFKRDNLFVEDTVTKCSSLVVFNISWVCVELNLPYKLRAGQTLQKGESKTRRVVRKCRKAYARSENNQPCVRQHSIV
jgi:hypothetical protein